MREARGLDVSYSTLTAAWVARRVSEGVELIIQDVWTGGYLNNAALKAIAESNLRAIREGGCIPAIYTNAAPWRPTQLWFDESVKNAGAELAHVQLVVIDLEIAEGNNYINPDDVRTFIELWEGIGKTVWTYSGDWYAGFWKTIVGERAVDFGKPYWYAKYDGVASLGKPTHPLGPIAGKQYGWTDIEGVTVDLNVFDMDQVAGAAVPQPQQEDWFDMATKEELTAIIRRELRGFGARSTAMLTDALPRQEVRYRLDPPPYRGGHWISLMAAGAASFESAWVLNDGSLSHQGVNQINDGKPFVIPSPGPGEPLADQIAGISLRKISGGRITVLDYSIETNA